MILSWPKQRVCKRMQVGAEQTATSYGRFFLCVSLVEEFHSEAPAIWLQFSLKRTCVLSSSYLEGKVDDSAELTEREIIT